MSIFYLTDLTSWNLKTSYKENISNKNNNNKSSELDK